MKVVIEFLKDVFDLNVFILFLISSAFLYYDSLDYNKKALHYEAKFAKYCAIFSIAIAIILYIITKILP